MCIGYLPDLLVFPDQLSKTVVLGKFIGARFPGEEMLA